MTDTPRIYFDHAATSWPKPPCVFDAMMRYMKEFGANPGRSGHSMSVDAARVVFEAREAIAEFFGMDDSENVAFTANATHALNIAIHGLVQPGDHVITTCMEHNSVLRPLNALVDSKEIRLDRIPLADAGKLDLDAFKTMFRANTRLVVAQHGSNVNGMLNPIREMGEICRDRGVLFLVDSAQTAGSVAIDVGADNIDLLAFTGHKSLLGPQGTGGLCVNTDQLPIPLYQGGTGSRSEEERHPEFMPDRFEAGTANAVGIAGLHAAIDWINGIGIGKIAAQEQALKNQLVAGLRAIPDVTVYSGELPVVSFSIDGLLPSNVGLQLDRDYGIMTRVGLHCAPAAHRTLGTLPVGTVRMGLGYANTGEQVETAIHAVAAITEGQA